MTSSWTIKPFFQAIFSLKKRKINKVFDKSHSINNELIIIVLLIINLYHCKQLKNIGITMRLICYPLEIQHGHNFRVTNQSFQFIVNFFGHLKMCFISIVIFCDNTKVQEMNSLKPSSLSWIFFCSSYAVSLKVKKLYMTSMWCDKKFNYLSLTFNPFSA